MTKNQDASFYTNDQEALLDLLLLEEGLDQDSTTHIPVREASGPVLLTYAQSRIWFLEQVNPGSSTFLIPTAIRLRISINESLLTEALHMIWRRHTILQMIVYEEQGRVFQKIGTFPLPLLPVIDLTTLAEADREHTVAEMIDAESKRPFNFTIDPLIRLSLIRIQPDEHIILLTTHHIISDGWSINILLSELMQAYMQLMQGRVVALPPLPIQYTDYAAWQQDWLSSDEVSRQFAYWQTQLQDSLTHTELPTDFARPSVQMSTGRQLNLTLPASLHQGLRKLGKQAGVTLYMTLMATFKVLLQRHIGQDSITIGSPVAGRQRPELEPLVGLFLNTLVLRTDLGGTPTFLDILERVRQTCIEAYANQDVPFEQLLAKMLPSRDASRTPFFQIFFNMLEFGQEAPVLDFGVEFIIPLDPNTKFDMTLYLKEQQHTIDLTLVYNYDLFTEAYMEDLLQQYKLLLQQIVHDPNLPIGRYSLRTDATQVNLPDITTQLSNQWEGSIFARLDVWAERRPQQTAVSDPHSQWTYQQVAIASNRLGQFLYQGGVQIGDVVAIYGYRCAALVPAIMGILKAGATVLILDPTYPEIRLKQYLALAQPTGLLSFSASTPPLAIQSMIAKTVGCQLQLAMSPKAFLSQLNDFSDQTPPISIAPDDRACLTFTSGSTGEPKGINGRHRSLTHFYPWMVRRFQFVETDRFSMLSGLAHDPLQRDMFTAIWVGAEICVPDPNQMWQPDYLAQWLSTSKITVTHLIPSMIHVLTAPDTPEVLSPLRLALFVGEPLKRHMAKQVKQLFPGVTIINLYGSSETQRAVSYHSVSWQQPEAPMLKQEIPIGVGMPGTQLLVLSSEQELVGIGELGELFFRSPHLALGYLQEEEKASNSFLQNPWTMVTGDKLYRTGDFGRYLPDGQVVFAGRRDTQVNIHGFRAELSEIEAVLVAHSAINAAVVTAVNQIEDNTQIVAYIVKEDGQPKLNPQQVQTIVKEKLPLPMVPTVIIYLDEIPLTPNGKIDARSLPSPDQLARTHLVPTSPRDHVEQELLSIWQGLLSTENISIYDEFFALGGHSILAIQMFSQIRDKFEIELNIGLLYQYATIAELAQLIRNQITTIIAPDLSEKTASTNRLLVQIRAGQPEQPLLCCVHGAGGNVMFLQNWLPYFDDWSIYGIQSPGVDGMSWHQGSLESLAADYVAALQIVQPHGPYLLSGYSGGGVIAYEMAQQLQAQGKEVSMLVLIDTYHPNVRSRFHSRQERLYKLRHQTKLTLKNYWRRRIADPLAFAYIMVRYVNRGKKVPLELREPILGHFYFEAKREYKPKPYHGEVLLVRSNEVMSVYDQVSPQLGWDGLLSEPHIAELPGNHFTIIQEPHIRHLAEVIEDTWLHIHEKEEIQSV